MGQSQKKKKQKRKEQKREVVEIPVIGPIDQEILDSIGNPNAWTPKIEDTWIRELRKLSGYEIYSRFPPMRKPPNVRTRGNSSGWGG
ncbi:hypothetical protein LCGC14_0141380 [marine sediment metagenome]|uniref:Uncharacterized protein n=1 Tax=marine sediment metagenome TaxID=412755 RepID=A0A0F9VGE5_9ZZZZ